MNLPSENHKLRIIVDTINNDIFKKVYGKEVDIDKIVLMEYQDTENDVPAKSIGNSIIINPAIEKGNAKALKKIIAHEMLHVFLNSDHGAKFDFNCKLINNTLGYVAMIADPDEEYVIENFPNWKRRRDAYDHLQHEIDRLGLRKKSFAKNVNEKINGMFQNGDYDLKHADKIIDELRTEENEKMYNELDNIFEEDSSNIAKAKARIDLVKIQHIFNEILTDKCKITISTKGNEAKVRNSDNIFLANIKVNGITICIISPLKKSMTILCQRTGKFIKSYSPKIMRNMLNDAEEKIRQMGYEIEEQ